MQEGSCFPKHPGAAIEGVGLAKRPLGHQAAAGYNGMAQMRTVKHFIESVGAIGRWAQTQAGSDPTGSMMMRMRICQFSKAGPATIYNPAFSNGSRALG
jgi:hypothetical protein